MMIKQKLVHVGILCLVLSVGLLVSCTGTETEAPTEVPSPPPTNTVVPSATPTEAPSNTPEPTATEIPTDTPVPTDTPTATPDLAATSAYEATQAAEAVLALVGEELAKYDLTTESGYLAWSSSDPSMIIADAGSQKLFEPIDEGTIYSTYVLHVDVAWESETGFAGCGVLFHSEPNLAQGKQYEFITVRVTGLPLWAVQLRNFNSFVSSATGGTKSNGAIDQADGAVNNYVLIVRDGLMTAYANGARLSNVIISSINEGRIAFFVWQESGLTTCTFSDAWIWVLEEK